MNVRLLKQGDEQEWHESFDLLWSIALSAAGRFLYIPPFSQQAREDVALQVMKEFVRLGINRCLDDDPESCGRWIWMRTSSRAIDFRRPRIVRRDGNQIELEDRVEMELEAHIEPVRISLEYLLDETIACLRLRRGRFSLLEEGILREILISGKLEREFAEEHGIPLGTVGRLVIQVKMKLRRFMRDEW